MATSTCNLQRAGWSLVTDCDLETVGRPPAGLHAANGRGAWNEDSNPRTAPIARIQTAEEECAAQWAALAPHRIDAGLTSPPPRDSSGDQRLIQTRPSGMW